MGAWNELDTLIKVNVDVSKCEEGKNLPEDDDWNVCEPWIKYLDDCIAATYEGSKRGAEEVAKRNRSFQQQIIRDVCDNPSGMLMTSIQEEQEDDYEWVVGTIINHISPMSIEYGRKGFSAQNAKALAFYYNGELIFRKSVGPAEPRPFVAPAYDRTMEIATSLVDAEIGKEYDKIADYEG